MSSQPVENKIFIVPYYESIKEESINFNCIVIPFSEFGASKKPSYIYSGHEKVEFKKRHLAYKKIFLNEFVE
ncbi:MAG: hypothetical protein KAT57_08605 [Candidatus Lokiarchaeota archaeon]|nr:hypothetical protein [Candidatus Lokiarchaeota archaeon]